MSSKNDLSSKRKYDLDNEENPTKRLKSQTTFEKIFELEKLPIEIIESILLFLPLNDIKSMRLVNQHFKMIIDTCKLIWQQKIEMVKKINTAEDVLQLKYQINKFKHIQSFHLIGTSEFKINKINFYKDNIHATDELNAQVALIMSNFSTEMVPLANLFNKTCECLAINDYRKEYVMKIMNQYDGNDDDDEENDDKDNSQVLLNLPNLKRLILSQSMNYDDFNLASDIAKFDYINCILNFFLIRKHGIDLRNIKQLTLIDFRGSLMILEQMLDGLNLDSFDIKNGLAYDRIFYDSSRFKKFNAKMVKLSGSTSIINEVLNNFANCESIEKLQVCHIDDDTDTSVEASIDIMYKQLSGKLTNLKWFMTTDSFEYFLKNNFQFPNSLKEARFMSHFDIDDLVTFVKDYLINFKSFEQIDFVLLVDCEIQNGFYRKSIVKKLQNSLNLMRNEFKMLKNLVFFLLCSYCMLNDKEHCDAHDTICLKDDNFDEFNINMIFKNDLKFKNN